MVRPTWLIVLLAVTAACVGLARVVPTYPLTDFHCFWNAGRFVIEGADPYDTVRWNAATAGLFPDGSGGFRPATCPGRFGYPLWTALFFAPFALLPEGTAAVPWSALLLVGAAAGVVLVWRAADGPWRSLPTFALVVAASQPFWFTVITLQLAGVLLGLVGILAAASRTARSIPAGLALACLAVKPHVVGLVLPVVAIRAVREHQSRLLAAGGALAFSGAAVSLAIAPFWPIGWLAEIFGGQGPALPIQAVDWSHVATAWALAATLAGDARLGVALIAPVLIATGLLVRGMRISAVAGIALAVATTLLVTPYAGSYDQLVLALPWAVILAIALRRRDTAGRALLVGALLCASILPWILDAYAVRAAPGEAASWTVVAATILLLAISLRLDRVRPEPGSS